ncbi:MAG TPA: MOSC domain-containing protein [Dehalococcoidia bacterium]|nr:MOSC domain-containing protein [Dehalococcoidia bacterium]
MMGSVVMLLVAPAAGQPVEPRERVELIAGRGVAGDRYAAGRGHWSDPRWPDQELTLFESEVAEELGLGPEQFRRNIVTRGVSLESLLGRRFRVGTALIEGVRPCDPCSYIEQFSRPGVIREVMGIRGGLRARILEGGTVRLGDLVVPA